MIVFSRNKSKTGPEIHTDKVAYFDSINAVSVWRAVECSLKGWKVKYFRQSAIGRVIEKTLQVASNGKVEFSAIDVQIGHFKRLFFETTRISKTFTEEWFDASIDKQSQNALEDFGQPNRTTAYVKKAMSLRIRRQVYDLAIFEGLASSSNEDARFFMRASSQTPALLDVYRRLANSSPNVSTYPGIFEGLGLISRIARYYFYISRQIVQRGFSVGAERERYLFAKAAMWPIGSRPSDDFLVDGVNVVREDTLLYYGSSSLKSRVFDAVQVAQNSGYKTVAWDRVAVSLGWFLAPRTLARYFVQPFAQTVKSLLLGDNESSNELVGMMLDLRRAMFGWDIFFEKYSVGAVFDLGVLEDQVAVTMSAHDHGAASIKIQMSEVMDDLNQNQQYLTHHYHYTWGQGVSDLWRGSWCADNVIPVGYIWGEIHQTAILKRQSTRDRYSVTEDVRLVTVFDTSVGRDNFVPPDALSEFYAAVSDLADGLRNVAIVVKPKDAANQPPELRLSDANLRGNDEPASIYWEDYLHANTNDLIAASDLVISMAHSSTFVEALICGVPAITYDVTERDWTNVLPHHEQFVVTNSEELCDASRDILDNGIDPQVWRDIQQQIRWNYGEADGLAIDRIRRHILDNCATNRTAKAIRELAVSNTGV